MGHKIPATAGLRRRRVTMPTHEIVAAIEFITSLFPRCTDDLVHTLLKQDAGMTGAAAPSEARVKLLLEQHREGTQRTDRSAARRKTRTCGFGCRLTKTAS